MHGAAITMKRLSVTAVGLLAVAFLLTGCAAGPQSEQWVSLFDGTSLDNWNRLGEANWRLADGAVMADRGGKTPSYLVSKNSYADFQLKVEFWVDADANSGVFLRCSDSQKVGAATAYEVQIADKRSDGYGTGAITDRAKASPMQRAAGQWNSYEITARGTQLTVALNGTVTASIQDGSYGRGPIALQYIAGVVKFRRVDIRPL
jgi:hypothetical protein